MINVISNMFLRGWLSKSKVVIVILLFNFLAACTDSAPNVFSGNRTDITCIAPDDFGYTKMTVNSKGYNVPHDPTNQYSWWLPIGTLYSGGPIAVFAYGTDYIQTSAWFPYLGDPPYSYAQLMTMTVATSNAVPPTTPPVSLYPQCIGSGASIQPNDYNIFQGCSMSATGATMQCPHLVSCDYCNPNDSSAPYMELQNVTTVTGQVLDSTVLSAVDGSTIPNVRKFSCFFTQGAGAYMLSVPSDGNGSALIHPNSDPTYIKDYNKIPGATVTNLYPPSSGGSLYNTNGVSVGGFQGTPGASSATGAASGGSAATGSAAAGSNILNASFGDPLYVKIIDNYYTDNVGSLDFDIKSGDTKIGPIQRFLLFMIDQLKTFTSIIFINLVKNSDYTALVRATMTLYLMFTGLMFSVGIVQITQKEMIIRVFKIVLVTALLTGASSWQFFNDYFFNIFTAGYVEFTGIVTGVFTGVTVNGDPVGSLSFFDKLIFLFFCPETTFKIWSLLFYNYVGIYMIPIIYGGIFVFIKVIAETAVYYIMTYMVICLLICMGPIFFIFILFGKTKAIFDNWVNQLASYLIQGIFYISALTMMTIIILNEFFKVIGFRACWVNIFSIAGQNIFNFFVPCYVGSSKCPAYLSNFSSTQRVQEISVPGWSYGKNADGSIDYTSFYQPYQHVDKRNIDFPFLDSTGYTSSDTIISDATLLNQLSSGEFGGIAHIGEGLIFLIVTVLGMKFMETVPQMAKAVSGTSGNQADIKGASHQAFNQMKSAARTAMKPVAYATRKTMQGLGKVTGATKLYNKVSTKLKSYDDKLSGANAKNPSMKRKIFSGLYKGTKFLVLLPGRAMANAMYAAVQGELHPKLKNTLASAKQSLQSTSMGLTGAVKDKFTPKFIKDGKERIADFDKKWDKLVQKAQAPLAKPFDKVMGKIEKLQEAASGTRANFRSRDSDEAVKKHFNDPKVFEKNPNARIDYMKDQNNSEGREVREFIAAIDRQRAMSRAANGISEGALDPNGKFKDCEKLDEKGRIVIDYTKAIKAYANDIHADQSLIPEALKRYAEIDKPDNGPLKAAANDLMAKQKDSIEASSEHLKAMVAFQKAYETGDLTQITAASEALSASREVLMDKFKETIDSQLRIIEEQKNFARDQAKYEILTENRNGVSRNNEPGPLDKSGLTTLQVNSDQATALQMNAEQRYYSAMSSFQANPTDQAVCAELYNSAQTAASYCARAADASSNYYQAQSRSLVDDAKQSMLSDIYKVKQGKKDHDY